MPSGLCGRPRRHHVRVWQRGGWGEDHTGLLVEGRGKRLFLGGDSFSPYGIDDYCAGNRNFLGEGRGFNQAVDLLKYLQPDAVFNQHQEFGVCFQDEHYDYMKSILARREELYSQLLPWPHPNFGTDVWWVRAYPYELDALQGETCTVEVRFTNHSKTLGFTEVEPVLPVGWTWDRKKSDSQPYIQPLEDGAARFVISVPENTPRGQYVVPFRITWNRRYLGQIRHMLVQVM